MIPIGRKNVGKGIDAWFYREIVRGDLQFSSGAATRPAYYVYCGDAGYWLDVVHDEFIEGHQLVRMSPVARLIYGAGMKHRLGVSRKIAA